MLIKSGHISYFLFLHNFHNHVGTEIHILYMTNILTLLLLIDCISSLLYEN